MTFVGLELTFPVDDSTLLAKNVNLYPRSRAPVALRPCTPPAPSAPLLESLCADVTVPEENSTLTSGTTMTEPVIVTLSPALHFSTASLRRITSMLKVTYG